ncbi:MAG TPA: hypothetical protein P5205_14490 [Candidatus Paceibacterota bacterium]|nr:hypothetical protein [Candidatus Paceibacterota bacterium]
MQVTTVTGETIRFSRWGALALNHVIECGHDWVANVSVIDGKKQKNSRRVHVFVSRNPDVAHLMQLALQRHDLNIQSGNG